MEIYVDGDACPVKEEVVRVATRHQIVVHMVSNQGMRLPSSPLVRATVVPGGMDKADDWIVAHIQRGDIVITGDIPLAARCLAQGARALGAKGKPFGEDGIGMAMAMRDLNAHLRESGQIREGGSPFQKQDRSRFLCALEDAIQAIKRGR